MKVELVGSKIKVTTTTGEDGTTLNDNKMFKVGSKVTITVTKDGYFAKKDSYTFEDKLFICRTASNCPQEHVISLTKEGKIVKLK